MHQEGADRGRREARKRPLPILKIQARTDRRQPHRVQRNDGMDHHMRLSSYTQTYTRKIQHGCSHENDNKTMVSEGGPKPSRNRPYEPPRNPPKPRSTPLQPPPQ